MRSAQVIDSSQPLRIAVVAPVAQAVPPTNSGSIEATTDLLVRGLAGFGHEVTLFATASSSTPVTLHATLERGYNEDDAIWPWELCELFNIAAAVEQADRFDVIHSQVEYAPLALAFQRITTTAIVQTLHHTPTDHEVALWSRYSEAPFIAISRAQAERLEGLRVIATVHHAVDTDQLHFNSEPDDYLLFLGRFTEGKGAVEAIAAARQANMRLILAAAENEYFRKHVASSVDGTHVIFKGEVRADAKSELLGRARALLYPVQQDEPFGLVLPEAMACGTPVAALNRGAVSEIVDNGVTGGVFDSLDQLVSGLPQVLTLDRARVRARAVQRFHPDRMVAAHIDIYAALHKERCDPRIA